MDAQGVHRKWMSMAVREALSKLCPKSWHTFWTEMQKHVKLNVIRLNPKAEVTASSETLEYNNYTETYHNIEKYNIHTGKFRHP